VNLFSEMFRFISKTIQGRVTVTVERQ